MKKKQTLKKPPYWITLKSDQDEVFLSGEMVIYNHWALGGNHLLGIAPAMYVGFPHGTEIYLSKKDSSHEERVTVSRFFVLKRTAWANAACKFCFTADCLQNSQLCLLTHSASACAGFSHPIFAHSIIYRHLGRETQLTKNACAEGSLALCWDSEISNLKTENLGRMTASFLNLIRGVSSTLTHYLQFCQQPAKQGEPIFPPAAEYLVL